MARPNLLILIPPAIFAAIAGLFLGGMVFDRHGDELPSALVGQLPPAVPSEPLGSLPPLTDEALRDGEVKLVNFWASWCAPCRVEHPHLTSLAAGGVPVYGIAYKDDPADSLAFLEELGNPYAAIAADRTGRTGLDWGLYGVPETFVLAGDGAIVMRYPGPITQAVLESRILPAMAEAAGR